MHVVFQEQDIHTLNKSFELDECLASEIILIKDDFAVGPLSNIYSPEGIRERKEWWRSILTGGDYNNRPGDGEIDDVKTVEELKEKLENSKEEKLWIWVAPNKHDVSGYYWLISQLKEFAGSVYVLSLNNLPFINDKGHIFYPVNLFEIPPREFLKAKKLARLVTASEFEIDPEEWSRICNENKIVRILEGAKKLAGYDEDFYDEELGKFITSDWQKAGKILHQFLGKSKETTGDAFLLWRLKAMIGTGKFDVQGHVGNMKDFEIKKKPDNIIQQ